MKSDIIQKYSKKSYSQLHKTAKRWFHKYIKLRDTDEYGYGNCIATGERLKYGTEKAQAGHFFAAGKHKALEFNEDNVNMQSKQDNYFGHDFASYSMNLINKIGMERMKQLDQKARASKKGFFKEDKYLMIEIIEKYKQKVKELAKTKMFEVK